MKDTDFGKMAEDLFYSDGFFNGKSHEEHIDAIEQALRKAYKQGWNEAVGECAKVPFKFHDGKKIGMNSSKTVMAILIEDKIRKLRKADTQQKGSI